MQVLIPILPLADERPAESIALARLELETIDQQPWIEYVLDRLPRRYAEQATFILPEACRRLYYFDELIHQSLPQARVVVTPDGVRGVLCMAMYACAPADGELCILSGNQALTVDWQELFDELCAAENDAAVVTMESNHPRWPHVRVNEDGLVTEASESHLLSRRAIAGVYYFRRQRDFLDCAEEVIRKGNQVEGQFGLPCTLNEMILRSKMVRAVAIDASSMTALATAHDCAVVG